MTTLKSFTNTFDTAPPLENKCAPEAQTLSPYFLVTNGLLHSNYEHLLI